MSKFRTIITFVLFFTCTSSLAHANILYDESVSGDLDRLDTTGFILQVGVNSVFGSSEYTSTAFDFDGFIVTLDSNVVLNSIDYYILNSDIIDGTVALYSGFYLFDSTYSGTILDYETDINILGSTHQSMFDSALPLSGNYDLAVYNWILGSSTPGGSWNYEIRFTTTAAPVPEPASMLLVGAGLAGLVGARLRKKKK